MGSFTLIHIKTHGFELAIRDKTKISFWNSRKQGTNIFNQNISIEDIQAAKNYGFGFIRLVPDKFLTEKRDFLIGDADNYNGLVDADLTKLKEILDICTQIDIPVVLSMLSLPGSRWKQNNNDKDDLRIWSNETNLNNKMFQKQAATFWKDLATELQYYSIVIGYNILNEPHPEKACLPTNSIQHQLFEFYQLSINAIRSVDKQTPIILDSTAHADPQAFNYLSAHTDPLIIYSFHMYEPFAYTNLKINNGQYSYPGMIEDTYWDKDTLIKYMKAIIDFQKRNNIESNRILVGEFGGNRKTEGLEVYFKDLISIFKQHNWHYAFYAFREDTWDGMDYELGADKIPWNSPTPISLLKNASYPTFQALLP